MWTDIEIEIPHDLKGTYKSTVDMTIFVAIGTGPERGLDGVLSICVTPLTDDWKEVSLMGKIEEKYSWNTIYINYRFPKVVNQYKGKVIFTTTSTEVDDQTYGGSA